MGARGPKPVSAEEIFHLASWFYRDFRALAEGDTREFFNRESLEEEARKGPPQLDDTDRAHIIQMVDSEIADGRLTEDQSMERIRTLKAGLLKVKDLDRWRAARDHAWKKGKKIPGEPKVLKALLAAKDAKQIQRICKSARSVIRAGVRQRDFPPGHFVPVPILGKNSLGTPEEQARRAGIPLSEFSPAVPFQLLAGAVPTGDFRKVRVDNWPIQPGSLFPEYLATHADQFIEAKRDPRFPRSDRPSNRLKQLWFLARALAGAVYGIKPRTAINLVGSLRPEQIFEESRAGKPARRRKRMVN